MAPIERVLDYPRDQVTQDTFYNCGPASTQTIIRAATGELIGEAQLAREMGTTANGTDHIGLLANALNQHVPGGDYRVVTIPNDPPSREQVNALWENLIGSIDAGHGVAANIIAPPSNYPRPSYVASQALNYGGGTVYHYIALMGYAVDSRGGRHIWWADSGFAPYGCWVTLEQTASLIAGKGYAFSNAPSKGMEINSMSESIMRDNQVQLRGPELSGWEVNSLVNAMSQRNGDRGTMVEIAASDLAITRDNQVQFRGPGLEGWDVKQLVEAANKRGGRATMVEMVAVCLQEIKALRAEVQALKGA
ncbi:hypothetical protein GP475_08705 [Corynebacterium poyangense]|uniref:Peptidase C39-like domain-containing protein n=2 Tax=Corynebacterium poyangense TaxID=2684405 RepID=A0A7H0SSG2_9CORY|nr:hypothetical protein GP475_08705 [Corynebacterium poyangense]